MTIPIVQPNWTKGVGWPGTPNTQGKNSNPQTAAIRSGKNFSSDLGMAVELPLESRLKFDPSITDVKRKMLEQMARMMAARTL